MMESRAAGLSSRADITLWIEPTSAKAVTRCEKLMRRQDDSDSSSVSGPDRTLSLSLSLRLCLSAWMMELEVESCWQRLLRLLLLLCFMTLHSSAIETGKRVQPPDTPTGNTSPSLIDDVWIVVKVCARVVFSARNALIVTSAVKPCRERWQFYSNNISDCSKRLRFCLKV